MTKRYSETTYLLEEVAEEYAEFADYFAAEVFGEPLGEEILTPARKRLFVEDEARDLVDRRSHELLAPVTQAELLEVLGDDMSLLPLAMEKAAAFQQWVATHPDRGPAVLRKAMALAEQQARAAIEEERVKRLGVFDVPMAGGMGL